MSCSEPPEENRPVKSLVTLSGFNDFIPNGISQVPNLEIEPGEYSNRGAGKYIIESQVDARQANLVYLKIKDTNGNESYQGFMLDGKKNGWWEVFNHKTITSCGNYSANQKNGFWTYYLLTKQCQKFVNFKNDTLDGLAQEYNKDSVLLCEGSYKRGLKSDYWKFFYINRKIKEQGYFYAGFKTGWWQSFEPNGSLIEEASYSRNDISGYVKKYMHGVLFEEGKSYNGKRRGTWKCYDETGKLKRIKEYDK